MNRKMIHRVLLALATVLAFLPMSAHASRIPIFYGTGDEMFEVGDFPKSFVEKFQPEPSYKLAYKCQHFSLFMADVWSWDCSLVVKLSERSYADLPDGSQAMVSEYSMKDAHRGFWNHYGFALVIAGFVCLLFLSSLGKSKETQAAED